LIENKANHFVLEVFSGKKRKSSITGKKIKEKLEKISGNKNLDNYCVKITRGVGIQKKCLKYPQHNSDLIVIGGRSIFNFGYKSSKTYRYLRSSGVYKENISDRLKYLLKNPKILLQNLVSSKIRIVGCFDNRFIKFKGEKGDLKKLYYLPNDTITCLILKDLKYARFILGILLSELTSYVLRDLIFVRSTLTIHLDKKYLEKIPIITPSERELFEIDNIVRRLEIFCAKNQNLTPVSPRKKPLWEKPADSRYDDYKRLKKELDTKIYKLYQLTPPEIEFVKFQLDEFDHYYSGKK
jgi:hypothetical protein